MATRDYAYVNWNALRLIGLLPLALGAFLDLWCVKDFIELGKGTPAPFDPPKNLVIKGCYRYVRNPMYTGLFLVLVGESALYASVFVFLYSLLVIAVAHIFVIFYEEPKLKKKFEGDYEQYLRIVPRWIPRIPEKK